MKSISEMTIGEFGAFVSDYLRAQGIDVVLSGGSCVTIYSSNRYQSFDLDFIGGHEVELKKHQIAAASQLSEIIMKIMQFDFRYLHQ